MARELTEKQLQEAETALYNGQPLPSGLAFERGTIRRLTDAELKADTDARKAEADRAKRFGVEEADAGVVSLGTPDAV